jgi:hypothetical protein
VIEDLLTGWVEMEKALPAYEEAEDFYGGEVEEFFASERIRHLVEATGSPYRFNFAAVPVDALSDRVEVERVTAADDAAATEAITLAWLANDVGVMYPDLIRWTCVYGDAYWMVWPYEDDGRNPELRAAGVKITYHKPKNTRMFYDEQDERTPVYLIKRWCVDHQRRIWRADLWYDDVVEHWQSIEGQPMDKDSSWEEVEEPEVNPFGRIPFFHYRTGIPYGEPVHKKGYGCQVALNKLLVTHLTTTDAHGWPQRYGLTDEGAVLDEADDSPDWEADEDADLVDGVNPSGVRRSGQRSAQRSGPGTMQRFTGMREVGTFDEADPDVFIKSVDMYVLIMAVLTRTPLHDFKPSTQPPSGESRRVAEAPLVKRAKKLQATLRAPVVSTWRFVAELAGRTPDSVIDVTWAPAYSATDTNDWQVVQLKQLVGVPTDQTLTEAGYEASQVATWLDPEPEAYTLKERLAMLLELAGAAQKLGVTGGGGRAESTSVGPDGVPVVTPAVEPDLDASAALALLLDQIVRENPSPA